MVIAWIIIVPLITLVLILGLQLLIIVCVAWTHAPFAFRDIWRDAWRKRKPKAH